MTHLSQDSKDSKKSTESTNFFIKSFHPEEALQNIKENWKAGLTVALISLPLSIALSIAAGAGPVPGIITGIWATLLAGIFGGSHYNIIGAAGALTTVLFAASVSAPAGLGAGVLPLLAIAAGLLILLVWAIGADRFLYYIPSSVMYGFATGVAVLIASSQLFDAAGLSHARRTGSFFGDVNFYFSHISETHITTVVVFLAFLSFMLVWKKKLPAIPAVIPTSLLGIFFGFLEGKYFHLDIISLGEKFGTLSGALFQTIPWQGISVLLSSRENILWLAHTAGIVAVIAILETLITEKIGDKLTHRESSSRRELFGLAIANLGSGIMGGLPATGVFIRTGANIKAGATHRTSALFAALFTGAGAIAVLSFFAYIPMAVIAAILVNTAIGLVEAKKFKEYWRYEKQSFAIMFLVAVVTIVEDAGIAVLLGAGLALVFFVNRISHGRFDAIFNFSDGTISEERGRRTLFLPPNRPIRALTYSISGSIGYVDSARHAANFRTLSRAENVETVILRLRNLFSIDHEAATMIAEGVEDMRRGGKRVCISSASQDILAQLKNMPFPPLAQVLRQDYFPKTELALKTCRTVRS